jgi:hypothetical protein
LLEKCLRADVVPQRLKAADENKAPIAALKLCHPRTSATPSFSVNCKAAVENETLIAAVNRCATQNQGQQRFFR